MKEFEYCLENSVIERLILALRKKELTISFMESASGGGLADAVTNVEGASEVLGFSAVTYSNEFKIKMGVPQDVILKYTVYSMETAREMARSIKEFSHSSIGVGVTGKLNRVDKYNLYGDDNVVFVAVFYQGQFHEYSYRAKEKSRKENKEDLILFIAERILEIL